MSDFQHILLIIARVLLASYFLKAGISNLQNFSKFGDLRYEMERVADAFYKAYGLYYGKNKEIFNPPKSNFEGSFRRD